MKYIVLFLSFILISCERPEPPPIDFHVGQFVRHKLDGKRGIVVAYYCYYVGGNWVTCYHVRWSAEGEATTPNIWEIEAISDKR